MCWPRGNVLVSVSLPAKLDCLLPASLRAVRSSYRLHAKQSPGMTAASLLHHQPPLYLTCIAPPLLPQSKATTSASATQPATAMEYADP